QAEPVRRQAAEMSRRQAAGEHVVRRGAQPASRFVERRRHRARPARDDRLDLERKDQDLLVVQAAAEAGDSGPLWSRDRKEQPFPKLLRDLRVMAPAGLAL